MKKILHKLKKNRLVSKIAAFFTICMILVSSLTISSFAADEEASAQADYVIPAGTYEWIENPFGEFDVTTPIQSNGTLFNSGLVMSLNDSDCTLLYYTTDADFVIVYSTNPIAGFTGWADSAYRTFILPSDLTVTEDYYFTFFENIVAPDPRTESVLNVFSGITDAIVDSLASVQNLFFTSGGSSITINSSNLVETDLDGGTVLYVVPLIGFSPVDAQFGSVYSFEFLDSSYLLAYSTDGGGGYYFVNSGDDSVRLAMFKADSYYFTADVWYLVLDEPFSGTATLTTPFAGSPQLTFLGVLAVIGVAIALAFLILAVISRFIRLRG